MNYIFWTVFCFFAQQFKSIQKCNYEQIFLQYVFCCFSLAVFFLFCSAAKTTKQIFILYYEIIKTMYEFNSSMFLLYFILVLYFNQCKLQEIVKETNETVMYLFFQLLTTTTVKIDRGRVFFCLFVVHPKEFYQ